MSSNDCDSASGKRDLSRKQLEIVECSPTPTMVIAGPGSGKITVIAYRFIFLFKSLAINPKRILVVALTNKSVSGLKQRISNYWPAECNTSFEEAVKVFTLNELCKLITKEICKKKNIPTKKYLHYWKFTTVISDVVRNYPQVQNTFKFYEILKKLRGLCRSQNRELTQKDLVDVAAEHTNTFDKDQILAKFPFEYVQEIYYELDEALYRANAASLDDIILDTRDYLNDENALKDGSSKYDAILCDQFQDVDDVQFDILTKLFKCQKNIFCVGEPDQSVYRFRSPVPKTFIKLENYFKSLGIDFQIYKMGIMKRSISLH